MLKWFAASWAAILVPFIVAGASGGPQAPWGHAVFHLGYIACALAAIVFLWRFRHSARGSSTRKLALALMAAQALFVVGQVAELLVVSSHPGPHQGDAALADPAHDAVSLGFTAPGLLLSALLLICLSVVFIVERRQRRAVAVPVS